MQDLTPGQTQTFLDTLCTLQGDAQRKLILPALFITGWARNVQGGLSTKDIDVALKAANEGDILRLYGGTKPDIQKLQKVLLSAYEKALTSPASSVPEKPAPATITYQRYPTGTAALSPEQAAEFARTILMETAPRHGTISKDIAYFVGALMKKENGITCRRIEEMVYDGAALLNPNAIERVPFINALTNNVFIVQGKTISHVAAAWQRKAPPPALPAPRAKNIMEHFNRTAKLIHPAELIQMSLCRKRYLNKNPMLPI